MSSLHNDYQDQQEDNRQEEEHEKFIIVFYIYLLIGSTISFFGVLIYTKIETGKSWKNMWNDF